jgi:septum formation protein
MTGRLTEPARLVLASGSPRRQQLLRSVGVDFTSVAPDIDERPQEGEEPVPYVERLAREKALAVTVEAGDVVVAGDTTVALGRRILGKPADVDDARRMLRDLSGRSHDVHTAVAVRVDGRVVSTVVTTRVRMVELSEGDLDWYVATGEPLDKAGAYALQEGGGLLVERIEGSASNVVGLPLAVMAELLADEGYPLSRFRAPTMP